TASFHGPVVYWSGCHPLKVEKGVRIPSGLLSVSYRVRSRLPIIPSRLRRGRCPAGSHKAGRPARYRGLRFDCGRAGARPSLINSEAVVQLPGPQLGLTWEVVRIAIDVVSVRSMARYANWHSGQAESLMSVGSTPTRATPREDPARRPVVQRQRHLSYKEETGVRFPPGRFE